MINICLFCPASVHHFGSLYLLCNSILYKKSEAPILSDLTGMQHYMHKKKVSMNIYKSKGVEIPLAIGYNVIDSSFDAPGENRMSTKKLLFIKKNDSQGLIISIINLNFNNTYITHTFLLQTKNLKHVPVRVLAYLLIVYLDRSPLDSFSNVP